MNLPLLKTVDISNPGDAGEARRQAKALAFEIGFTVKESEEIAVVVSELASNLMKHATYGTLIFTAIVDDGRPGIQIESIDSGPGIIDPEQAISDGFSTVGSLGYGLGTVNRLMSEFDIISKEGQKGTYIVCKKWTSIEGKTDLCPLSFGAATRSHPAMKVNGDAFIIKKHRNNALAGVIDGLGHGQFAHIAAQKARQYIESHSEQPLELIFRGIGRACRVTRGVVLALARFDWDTGFPEGKMELSFASIGNITARVVNSPKPFNFVVRRGVIGLSVPNPVFTKHAWNPSLILIIHSDGLRSKWSWLDFPQLTYKPPDYTAQQLIKNLALDNDDATVVVVKGKEEYSGDMLW